MLKLLLINLVFFITLNAIEVEVKKGNVNVTINTKEILFKKGQKQQLKEGTTICYIRGKGKLIFKELKKQLKQNGHCLMIPLNESNLQNFLDDIKNKFTIAFLDSSEDINHGTGTKAGIRFKKNGDFILTPHNTELLIYSKEYGPLPVNIFLKDAKGNKILQFENDQNNITIFHIDKKQLKSGMYIEIYNGFEELLLKRNIIIKNN